MIIRFLLIGALIVGAIYLVRALLPALRRNPILAQRVMGLGRNVAFIYFLRRAVPSLLRALGSLRFFR